MENNPGLRAKDFIEKVKGKTGLSRSTIYVHLDSFVNDEDIFRDKCRYWIRDPKKDYRARTIDRKMLDHYTNAVKGLEEYPTYKLLLLVDSGEFETRFPEFAGHVKTGYKKLSRLFQRWSELPLLAKVTNAGENSKKSGSTEAQQKLADDVLREVDLKLDFVIRRVKNGSKLEGRCDICPI